MKKPHLHTRGYANCNGVRRRDFIQIGLTGLMGVGMADLLRLRAQAAEGKKSRRPEDINCILVWLDGGPTHFETFDPKPDAPDDIRGKLKPIATSADGIQFSEAIPNMARVADKVTILRSVCHKDPNHGGGNHYMMTGAPTPVPVNCGAFVTFHPSFGSVVSSERGIRDGLPAYMSVDRMSRSGGPNFLGAEHAPFVIGGDPNRDGFRVRDVALPKSISEGRAKSRLEIRQSLDRLKRMNDHLAADPTVAFDGYYEQAVDLIASKDAQEAFEIGNEDQAVREKYGRNTLGQRLLLCRRLVEVGVSFVTCYYGGWDHHVDIFKGLESHMPPLDQGVAALIEDLEERGLLDTTLVLVLGEFGRTPKINERGGRDHWPHAMSILTAGAGIPKGQVVGATDPKGYYASENVYSPEDFACSLYTKMGVDPHQTLYTPSGRPIRLVNGGNPIPELFS